MIGLAFTRTCIGGPYILVKTLTSIVAVAGAAALTLASMLALVQGTISAVSISDPAVRVLAVCADIILGTVLLVGCIYLATHLAVRVLGVGNAEFPPTPNEPSPKNSPRLNGPVPE